MSDEDFVLPPPLSPAERMRFGLFRTAGAPTQVLPDSPAYDVYKHAVRVQKLADEYPYITRKDDNTCIDFVDEIVVDAVKSAKRGIPLERIIDTLQDVVIDILASEYIFTIEQDYDLPDDLSFSEKKEVRHVLTDDEKFFRNYERYMTFVHEMAASILTIFLIELPGSVFEEQADENQMATVPLIELMPRPTFIISRMLIHFLSDAVPEGPSLPRIFTELRYRLRQNIILASGMTEDQYARGNKKLIMPAAAKGGPREIANAYLGRTPLAALFNVRVPFSVPLEARFSHTHVVGGTGHGKTQLLQLLIDGDLQATDGRSIVIIDGQGDLIDTVSHLPCFHPDAEGSLADKFLMIEPKHTETPVSLNMFDVDMGRLEKASGADREMVLNGVIDAFEYVFGELLGAKITQKQSLIFRYSVRLMLEIPNATIHTMRDLLTDETPFEAYFDKLDREGQLFFKTQFSHKEYARTRDEVMRRLWGILENKALVRMFNNPRNKVDLFDALNQGKIIFISTSEDLLKPEGSKLFGRFFIAMIAQAALERAVLDKDERSSVFMYIDEAHTYIDDKVEKLLNQARKYRVGLVLAHQNLAQLETEKRRATFASSTNTKFVGGVNVKDARIFSEEMRCTPETILNVGKEERVGAEFASFVRNITPSAVRMWVPFGVMEKKGRISDDEYDKLLALNFERYGAKETDDDAVRVASSDANHKPHEATPDGSGEDFELEEPEQI